MYESRMQITPGCYEATIRPILSKLTIGLSRYNAVISL
jgi:hypothetical protein